jgi:hypothetical protein
LDKKYNSGMAGRLVMLFNRIRREVSGPEPAVLPPPVPVAPVPPPAAVPERLIRLQHVLDQASNEFCAPLSDETRSTLRQNHIRIAGGDPQFGKEPSGDQLSAMFHRLKNGGPPFADFAVFTPHGERHARYHKFDAQILVDGAWASNRIPGPKTFAAWKESWAVFKATMISLQCLPTAVIDAYEAGIAALVMMFPQDWGAVFAADEIMRGEMWRRTAERFGDRQVSGAGWPDHVGVADRWAHVVKITTFGGDELSTQYDHWWRMHVIYPCQSHSATIPFIQAVEGTQLVPAPGGFVGHDGQAPGNQGQGRGSSGRSHNRRNKAPTPPVQQPNWTKQPWKAKHWQGKNPKGQGKEGKGKGKDGKGGKGEGKDGKPDIRK